eukprot:TRINITY_DN1179_c0_g1_i4.p1 TRINITY_DN1179_c0_g1~~TRINITY_DN1179_c0_g1_i4.p1  ORF type:complete len:652 (-),score=117.60 TRINITY_DN1179_c0_g1_i4:57-2012(-)
MARSTSGFILPGTLVLLATLVAALHSDVERDTRPIAGLRAKALRLMEGAFNSSDTDADGSLSMDELEGFAESENSNVSQIDLSPAVQRDFYKYDENKDGRLTEDEFVNMMSGMKLDDNDGDDAAGDASLDEYHIMDKVSERDHASAGAGVRNTRASVSQERASVRRTAKTDHQASDMDSQLAAAIEVHRRDMRRLARQQQRRASKRKRRQREADHTSHKSTGKGRREARASRRHHVGEGVVVGKMHSGTHSQKAGKDAVLRMSKGSPSGGWSEQHSANQEADNDEGGSSSPFRSLADGTRNEEATTANLADKSASKKAGEATDKSTGKGRRKSGSRGHRSDRANSQQTRKESHRKEAGEAVDKSTGKGRRKSASRGHRSDRAASQQTRKEGHRKEAVEATDKSTGKGRRNSASRGHRSDRAASRQTRKESHRKEVARQKPSVAKEVRGTRRLDKDVRKLKDRLHKVARQKPSVAKEVRGTRRLDKDVRKLKDRLHKVARQKPSVAKEVRGARRLDKDVRKLKDRLHKDASSFTSESTGKGRRNSGGRRPKVEGLETGKGRRTPEARKHNLAKKRAPKRAEVRGHSEEERRGRPGKPRRSKTGSLIAKEAKKVSARSAEDATTVISEMDDLIDGAEAQKESKEVSALDDLVQ